MRRALVIAVCALLLPVRAWSVCSKSNVCGAASLIADAACCGATSCTIDGTVTVSGPTCTFDFGGRNLTVSGQFVVGSRDVAIRAASVVLTGKIDGRGRPGGNVTIQTTGRMTTAFRLFGGVATQIDVSGSPAAPGGRAAGSLIIQADSAVSLAGGSLAADGVDANSDGGLILIESTANGVSIDVPVTANAGLNGSGGSVIVDAPGVLQIGTGTLSANGSQGSIDVSALSALGVGGGARLLANALGGSGADGGTVDIRAASIDVAGIIEATGGSDPTGDIGGLGGVVTIAASDGPLQIVRGTLGINVDGAPGSGEGEINLSTESAADGDLTIDAPIEAVGKGGIGILGRPGAGGLVSAAAGRSLFIKKNVNISGAGDFGGSAELSARGDVSVTGAINANDVAGGGFISIEAERGDVTINADLQAKAAGNRADGTGGDITISAGNDLVVANTRTIDVSGASTGGGGTLDFEAGRNLSIGRAMLHADAGSVSGAPGGDIALAAGVRLGDPGLAGNLTIEGRVTANGRPPTAGQSFTSSTIELGGCAVLVTESAFIDSSGDTASRNRVTARTSVRLIAGGKLKTTAQNIAIYPTGSPPITGANTVEPPFTAACPGGCARAVCTGSGDLVGCLVPCPNCGNGTREYPEDIGCDPPGCNKGCDSHCRRLPNGGCNDNNPCTADSCDPDPEFGCLQEPRDGEACDNTTVCDGREVCVGDVCDPGEPLDCDDDEACTADSCNATGGCINSPISGNPPGCDDHCTERCTAGKCEPITPPNCNDGNPSTNDFCDPADGTCHHEPGASCTSNAQCNDGNPCTTDACPNGKCQNEFRPNGTSCADSSICNGAETCQSGTCQNGTPLDCDDDDPCTDDACDPVAGCSNTPIPGCCETAADCNDGNPCTNDDCQASRCVNVIDPGCCSIDADCDDGNPCTDDSACVAQRCTHTPVSGERSGCGDACRDGTCQAGTCQLADPIVCSDDGDVCTDDFCDGDTGCVHLAIPDCCRGTVAGECGDACTFCDLESHECGRQANCRTCTRDSDCDPDGRCAGSACGVDGLCGQVPAFDCADGNPETSDVCRLGANDQPTCEHRCLTDNFCDDRNPCNGVETCSAGSCVAGVAPSCDDADPCTDDSCVAPSGCQHPAKTGYASARCRFDRLTQALRGAGTADIAAAIRSKIEKLIGVARSNVDAAETAGTPRQAKR